MCLVMRKNVNYTTSTVMQLLKKVLQAVTPAATVDRVIRLAEVFPVATADQMVIRSFILKAVMPEIWMIY